MSIIGSNILAGASGQAGGGGAYEISRSVRFNSSDSAYLSKVFSSAGNRTTWTWSGWVKQGNLSTSRQVLFGGYGALNDTDWIEFGFDTNNFYYTVNSAASKSPAVFRDVSAWQHVTVTYNGSNLKWYSNGVEVHSVSTTGNLGINGNWVHTIGKSPNSGQTRYFDGYLADIHFIDGQALDPSSFGEFDTNGVWQPIDASGLTYGTNGFRLPFSDNSTAAALGTDTSGNGNDWTVNNISVGVTSVTNPAWYASSTYYSNVADVLANATNKGAGSWTASNEFVYLVVNSGGKPGSDNVSTGNFPITWVMYRNTGGTLTRQGSFGGTELPSFDWSDSVGTYTISNFADFYIFSDQDANPPTSGQLSGTIPALTTASFRTVSDINAGNDSLVDSPTNGSQVDTGVGGEVVGNYATWNPLANGSNVTLSNGNLDYSCASGTNTVATSSIAMSSGKWYCEFTATSANHMFGLYKASVTGNIDYLGVNANGWGYYWTGQKYTNSTGSAYGSSYTTSDVIGVAFDADAGSLYFYKNGAVQNSGTAAFTGLTSGPYVFATGTNDAGTKTAVSNFGQRAFAYTAPSGFKALCTTNLPEPTIADGSTVMDVKLYTGNGSTQTISGLNFGTEPGLLWIKSRNNGGAGYDNILCDNVRGSLHYLESNRTDAEYVSTAGNDVSGFITDGFTLGPVYNFNGINGNLTSNVAWTWNAGSSTVTNTAGSITSSVRANASAGFSVVGGEGNTYFGGTLGHGLGVAPEFILAKDRDSTAQWYVYHKSLTDPNNYHLILNSTSAQVNFGSNLWNVTSTTIASNQGVTGRRGVYYCFAPVAGYSSFGSYTGNGSADGPFVYTGFRSRWILIKRTDSSGNNWVLHDTARDAYNAATKQLLPSTSDAETDTSVTSRDILSNGFKLRGDNGAVNASSATYIYAAFAENPFQYARAR
jgi:hypothetical protein